MAIKSLPLPEYFIKGIMLFTHLYVNGQLWTTLMDKGKWTSMDLPYLSCPLTSICLVHYCPSYTTFGGPAILSSRPKSNASSADIQVSRSIAFFDSSRVFAGGRNIKFDECTMRFQDLFGLDLQIGGLPSITPAIMG